MTLEQWQAILHAYTNTTLRLHREPVHVVP